MLAYGRCCVPGVFLLLLGLLPEAACRLLCAVLALLLAVIPACSLLALLLAVVALLSALGVLVDLCGSEL